MVIQQYRCNKSSAVAEMAAQYCVCHFLLVNITNLHPSLHRYGDIAGYWSNFRCRPWVRTDRRTDVLIANAALCGQSFRYSGWLQIIIINLNSHNAV